MDIKEIDLYDYFKVARNGAKGGKLVCYTVHDSYEINTLRKHPAMLVIPGGGYSMVSEREAEPVAIGYLNKGFNAFILTYSCAPTKYPYPLAEAEMAMAYLKVNAEELHINKNRIAAVGFSAGGHLTAMLGSCYNVPSVKSVFTSNENLRPNAVILSYPVFTATEKTHSDSFYNLCGKNNKELIEKLSAENLIDKNSAPAFIWATYNDGCVPVRNSLIAASAYEKAGVPFSIHIWGNGEHGLSVADDRVYPSFKVPPVTPSLTEWLDLSVEWLKEQNIKVED